MNKQTVAAALAVVLVAGMLVTTASNTIAADHQTPGKPNIVLFLVDDMGWMDSTPYGSQYYTTPNMKRLERQSMRFTSAYATPLCSPTRASILSGQYSSRHGVTSASGHQAALPVDASRYPTKASTNQRFIYPISKRYLDPELDTLAEILRDAGYRTGHFGKWHLGLSKEYWPDKHGFEVAFHAEPSPGPSSYFSPYRVHKSGDPGSRHHVGTITDGPEGEYITDRLTDEAIKFIEANRDEPFFLNFWHYAVHGPWGHKEEYTKQFAEKADPRGKQENPIMASMLKSVDESLCRVLDKLDELELTGNTLFVFYSDNGGNTHSNVPGSRGMDVKKGHAKYPEVRELYNLKEDIGEENNLASRMPDKVKELEALIDQFVKDTGALVPKPNPNFNSAAPSETKSDPIAGLVARMCKVVATDDAIRITAEGRQPFLGTAQVRFNGPLTLKLRARRNAGGKGRVRWRTAGQDSFPESSQIATYDLPAGTTWQDISVSLPVQGKPTVIRLYLPAGQTAVEVQSIQFLDKNGRNKSWDFAGETP